MNPTYSQEVQAKARGAMQAAAEGNEIVYQDLFSFLYSRRPLADTTADRIASDALPPASSVPGPHGQPLLSGLAGAMSDEQRELHYRRLRTRRMRDSVDRIYGVLATDMDLRGVAEELDHLELAIKMWRQEIETAAKGGAA